MKLLLDTHIFLWFLIRDPRLPDACRDALRDPANQVYLSVVSVWEAMIKYGLGKLPLTEPPETYLPRMRHAHAIASLPVDEASVTRLGSLPALHHDPFDRLLICQALEHGMTLVSVDASIRAYPVPVL